MKKILTILVILLVLLSITQIASNTILLADPWDIEPVDIPVPDPDDI